MVLLKLLKLLSTICLRLEYLPLVQPRYPSRSNGFLKKGRQKSILTWDAMIIIYIYISIFEFVRINIKSSIPSEEYDRMYRK